MNRRPSELRSTPPSPRTDSVTSKPRTDGGQTMPVGWNWTNSILISVAPARRARAWPSPVYSQELDVTFHDLPMPPVASTTAGASNDHEAARLAPVPEGAGNPVAVFQQIGDR